MAKKPKIKRDYAAERAAAEAQAAANNMAKNFAANLKNENIPQVVPGGTDVVDNTVAPNRKRRVAGTGLSTQLGINA